MVFYLFSHYDFDSLRDLNYMFNFAYTMLGLLKYIYIRRNFRCKQAIFR